MPAQKGFTLVELLVVISIIAVLSVIGITVYGSVQKSARDAKRRADIDAISKAYEVNYSSGGKYVPLQNSNFSANSIPQDPNKGTYFNWLSSDGSGFKVCAALEANPNATCNNPATNCICKFSVQGALNTSSTADASSTNTQLGLGGSSSLACDPNGTLNSGLVGYWKMDETVGSSSAADSSGSGNTGTYTNGATTVTGKFANAASLNGSNQIISVPNASSLNITAAITLSAWIKTSGSNDYAGIIQKALNGNNPGYQMGLNLGNSGARADIYTTAGTAVPANGTNVENGNWHLITATYDGLVGKIYVDGNKGTDYSRVGTITTTTDPLVIGNDRCCGSRFFNGLVDDVRVYNRALGSGDISLLYNGGSGCVP